MVEFAILTVLPSVAMDTLSTLPAAPVLVTAATPLELDHLARALGTAWEHVPLRREVATGEVNGIPVLLAVTGMGKVNAASAVTSLLEHCQPRLLVNTGCAGAYGGSDLAVGDLAVASVEIYGDDGVVTTQGWEPLDLIGIPLLEKKGRRYYNEFPLSLSAGEKAMRLAVALGLPAKRGRFVTVSACSGSVVRGDELAARFGALCENMEGAAVAHVALMYGVDCLEVRGISNMVEDRDLSRWDIPRAVESVQRFVLKYIESL